MQVGLGEDEEADEKQGNGVQIKLIFEVLRITRTRSLGSLGGLGRRTTMQPEAYHASLYSQGSVSKYENERHSTLDKCWEAVGDEVALTKHEPLLLAVIQETMRTRTRNPLGPPRLFGFETPELQGQVFR
jgi:hypothetical protein